MRPSRVWMDVFRLVAGVYVWKLARTVRARSAPRET
jgi:hypothetical protein